MLSTFMLRGPSVMAAPNQQSDEPIAFVNVNVIPMDSERVLDNQTVIVVGDRIAEIGPVDQVTPPSNAQIVEADGHYLIPGLSDMHWHFSGNPDSLTLAVANGVTTIQNLNSDLQDLAWAAEVAAGERFGPRVVSGPHAVGLSPDIHFVVEWLDQRTGPFFSPHGYVSEVGQRFRAPYGFQYDAESGRQFVHQAKELGGNFIKTNLFLTRETFDAIVETANELGMKVQGHVWDDIGVEHYIRSGGQIHHITEVTPYVSQNAMQGIPAQKWDFMKMDNLPALVALMQEHEMSFTPTLDLSWYIRQHYENFDGLLETPQIRYVPPQEVNGWRDREHNLVYANFGQDESAITALDGLDAFQSEFITALAEADVTLLAGTDCTALPGMVCGFTIHQEIELMAEYGLTAYQALETATRNPAEFLDEANEWGTVEEGKRADLVLLSANPLDDLANTRQIAGVVLRGQWYPQSILQQMLDELAAEYEAQAAGAVELAPFAGELLNGVAPSGWHELEPGVFAQGDPDVDPTLLVQLAALKTDAEELAKSVLAKFDVAELPAPVDSYESPALTWSLYMLDVGMVSVGLALAQTDQAAYLILLSTPSDKLESLAETVLFPAVDSFRPAE